MTMPTLLRLSCAAWIVVACSHARAAENQMPIDFVGEWCTPTKDGNTTEYTLPSWTNEGKCTEILSVDRWGFAFNMGGEKEIYCSPESIRTKQDTAPSGTAYLATILATCAAGDTLDRKSHRTYEFKRYKGRLTIEAK
jgi:hypothetical protein